MGCVISFLGLGGRIWELLSLFCTYEIPIASRSLSFPEGGCISWAPRVLWAVVAFALQSLDNVVSCLFVCLFVLNSFRLLYQWVPLESSLAGNENGFCNLEFVWMVERNVAISQVSMCRACWSGHIAALALSLPQSSKVSTAVTKTPLPLPLSSTPPSVPQLKVPFQEQQLSPGTSWQLLPACNEKQSLQAAAGGCCWARQSMGPCGAEPPKFSFSRLTGALRQGSVFLIHHQLTWTGNKKSNLPFISLVQWAFFFKPSAPLSLPSEWP